MLRTITRHRLQLERNVPIKGITRARRLLPPAPVACIAFAGRYWITHDDAAYNTLMEDVSAFINDPVTRRRGRKEEEGHKRAVKKGSACLAPHTHACCCVVCVALQQGARDVPVKEVFTQRMFDDLAASMAAAG
jgi:hypothetical protein